MGAKSPKKRKTALEKSETYAMAYELSSFRASRRLAKKRVEIDEIIVDSRMLREEAEAKMDRAMALQISAEADAIIRELRAESPTETD